MSDMTRKEHINRLKAMQDCIKHYVDPNYQCDNCDNCEINYRQGKVGEIRKTLAYAISSLETDEAYQLEYERPKSEWEHDHEILKAYSDGANEVLDKIRAEIEQEYKVESEHPYGHGLRRAIEIIDKYKAGSEDNNAEYSN